VALSKDELALLARFGGNVRRLRVDAELTQAALAERMGLEIRTVQKFEAGEINVPLVTLHRIRRALGCRWEALLGEAAGTRATADRRT
jgi:transcriptional regulator with XRE-family HTH domain